MTFSARFPFESNLPRSDVKPAHFQSEQAERAAVTKALREFIARRQQKKMLDLIGKLEWDASHDYKAERSRK